LLCCLDGLALEVIFACAHASTIAVLVRAIRCSEPRRHCSRDRRPDPIHINKKELLVCSRGLFMTRQVPISYRLPFACVFDARSKRLSTMPGCRNRRITTPRRQSAEQLHGAMREESKEIIDHGRGRNNLTRFPARATRIDPAPELAKLFDSKAGD
jgi:hypothetical protein